MNLYCLAIYTVFNWNSNLLFSGTGISVWNGSRCNPYDCGDSEIVYWS